MRSFGCLPCSILNWLRKVKTSFSRKAPQKTLRVLDLTRISPFVGPTRKEAPTGNVPMRAILLKAVTSHFPQAEENQTSEALLAVFDPTIGEGSVETPLFQFLKSLPPSTSRRSPTFFQKRLANNQLFIQRVKHYHQWLRTVRFPLILSQYKAFQKDQALADCIQHLLSKNTIERVENVKSRVLQSPVSSPQASLKVEASNRPKQAQHFSTCRKAQDGNSRVHQDLSGSRGMGIIDRPIGCLPSHRHSPKLKGIPKVLPQVSGVPVHLPSFWTSRSPPGLCHDCKGSEANGPLQRTQTSPIPGRLTDQVPVSGGRPSEHSGSVRPNPWQSGNTRLPPLRPGIDPRHGRKWESW